MENPLVGAVFEIDTVKGRLIGLAIDTPSSGSSQASGNVKAGTVSADQFSGTPQTASVTFADAFTDTEYAIVLSGEDARIFTYQEKEVTGFTINTNSNGDLSHEVSWMASPNGG
jgi:hypothetical protein